MRNVVMRKIFLIAIFVLGFVVQGWGGVKLGVLTDIHFNGDADRVTSITRFIDIANAEGVSGVVTLGDNLDTSWTDIMRQGAETAFDTSNSTVYWVLGNNDKYGHTDEQLLQTPYYRGETGNEYNYYFEIGEWRFVIYDNALTYEVDVPSATLTWLSGTAFDTSKNIAVFMHERVDGIVANAAGTVTSNVGVFRSNFVGNKIHMKFGASWEEGTITAYTDKNTATVTGLTTSATADEFWIEEVGGNGHAHHSKNALAQRALFEAAGVERVFMGHWHDNDTPVTISGVKYYPFEAIVDQRAAIGAGAVVEFFDDGTIEIFGIGFQTSYETNDTYWVSPTGSNDNSGRLESHAWATIAYALTQFSGGETLTAADGTYTEHDLSFGGKAITIQAKNKWQAIQDANNEGIGWLFDDGETSTSILDGLKIINGSGTAGAGIRISVSSPDLLNLWIDSCTASDQGGGILFSGVTATSNLKNSKITNCTANYGGGVRTESEASPILIGCILDGNTGTTQGGAAMIRNNSDAVFYHCVISNNLSAEGAALRISTNGSLPVVRNSILWGNTLLNGTTNNEIHLASGVGCDIDVSYVEGGFSGTGAGSDVRTADPLLLSNWKLNSTSLGIDTGSWIDTVNNTGVADIWGKYVHRLPNIGVDQGAGAPKGGSRSNRIGGGSGMGL